MFKQIPIANIVTTKNIFLCVFALFLSTRNNAMSQDLRSKEFILIDSTTEDTRNNSEIDHSKINNNENYQNVRGHFASPSEQNLTNKQSSASRFKNNENEPDSFDIKQRIKEAREQLNAISPESKKDRDNSSNKRSWVANMSLGQEDLSVNTHIQEPTVLNPTEPEIITTPEVKQTQTPQTPATPTAQSQTQIETKPQFSQTNLVEDAQKTSTERNEQLAEEIIQRAASITRRAKDQSAKEDSFVQETERLNSLQKHETPSNNPDGNTIQKSSTPTLDDLRKQIRKYGQVGQEQD